MEKFIKALGLRGSREAIRQWYHRLSKLIELVLESSQWGWKITTDKGWWYKRACREPGLEWRHETFGGRNAVERAFFPIKHRLKGFYKRFPWNAKFETISSFLRAFIFLYYTLEGLS
ncbi:MAG: hypothetical protein Q9N34_04190 [Aquificota bacterium]|nr:hypothetical protein [Aquificota bacterium]